MSYDLIVIGTGPGGYVCAIRAAQLGMKTAVVEREHLGGICLNWGCIPTKALLRSAEIYHYMQHAEDYGLKADNVGFDAAAVVKRSRGVSKRLNDGVGFLMKKNKVTVIWGEASIEAPGKVAVKAGRSEAPKGALGIIVVWGLLGPVFDYSDTWQLVINTGTTVITFLMVFLIQRTQNKEIGRAHV